MNETGYYATGFEPNVESALLVEQPVPADDDLIERLRAQDVAAKTANLQEQSAFSDDAGWDRIFAHRAPCLLQNWQMLLDHIERVKQHRVVEKARGEDNYLANELDF